MQQSTYWGHQLIRASHPCHFVLVQVFLDEALHRLVPFHKGNIGQVEAEEHQCLIPVDVVIPKEDDESDETGRVEGAVAEQGPPGESEHSPAENGAHANHKQDVEDGRTDDGANANVVKRHKHADDASEEFGCGPAGRHEGGTGHVVLDVEFLDDHVQRRHEELVADDGKRNKHINHSKKVEDHSSVAPLFHREQVLGEQRVLVGFRDIFDGGVVFGDVLVKLMVILKAGPAERAQEQTARREQPHTLHGF